MNNQGTLDKTIAHLNVQIDFLQEANHKLETALEAETQKSQELQSKVQELSKKNATICSELRNIDNLAEQIEEEKANVLAKKDKRIQELEVVFEMCVYVCVCVCVSVRCVCVCVCERSLCVCA